MWGSSPANVLLPSAGDKNSEAVSHSALAEFPSLSKRMLWKLATQPCHIPMRQQKIVLHNAVVFQAYLSETFCVS